MPDPVNEINGVEMPTAILGNGNFPLQSWIVEPHGDGVWTPDKAYFNFHSSRSRMVTEDDFGKLDKDNGTCMCCLA